MSTALAASLLGPDDRAFLDDHFVWDAVVEAGMVCITISSYPLADGLAPDKSDLLIRLPAGFPDVGPDMFWFGAPVTLAGGAAIPQTQVMESHLGTTWQRWSRHIGGDWRPGIDNLRSYMRYVQTSIEGAAS